MRASYGTVVRLGAPVAGVTPEALITGARDRSPRPAPDADYLARTMLQTYDWQGALDSCREVLKQDPDHLGALEVAAQALWFAGEFEDVIRTTNHLLKLNPLEPGYRYTRGMAQMSVGELAAAADDFRQALLQSDDARFLSQVRNALTAIEEFQTGSFGRVFRMNAAWLAGRNYGLGNAWDTRVH